MQGLTYLYGFDTVSDLGVQGRKKLVLRSSDATPAEHALAFWVRSAGTIDIVGIYRASEDVEEEARRQIWRDSIRYRFASACELVWTYMLNCNPELVEQYKRIGFQQWRELRAKDGGYRKIMSAAQGGVKDVPVSTLTDQGQNLVDGCGLGMKLLPEGNDEGGVRLR